MRNPLLRQIFKNIHPKYRPFGTFVINLGLLTIPALLLISHLRSNPSIQSTMSLAFPVYHLGEFMMICAKGLLSLLGFQAILTFETNIYHYGVFALQIGTGVKVFLGYSCLGLGVMLVYSALIISWPGRIANKIPYVLLGITMIFILNVSRMAYLTWLSRDGTSFANKTFSLFGISRFDHHDLFNYFIYAIILFLFILWIERFSKSGRHCEKTALGN